MPPGQATGCQSQSVMGFHRPREGKTARRLLAGCVDEGTEGQRTKGACAPGANPRDGKPGHP
eukprot:12987302-Alexandrium_andersonii.AAC.1